MTAAPTRAEMGQAIAARLGEERDALAAEFKLGPVRAFALDDALPAAMAGAIADAFPPTEQLVFKDTLRERKHVGVAMDAYAPVVKDAVFAWQAPEVVRAVAEITSLKALEPDPELYAGGISAMVTGAYLRPHVDNSHDHARARYRVLNLLHYVSPDWDDADGGALELWDAKLKNPRVLPARFNRLVVMATDTRSWHSVSPVRADDKGARRCVSNYYFSKVRPAHEPADYAHVTRFRGRPGEPLIDAALQLDGLARNAARRFFKHGPAPTRHIYRDGAG